MNESVTNETGSKDSSQLYFYLFVCDFLCKNVHWWTMHNKTTDIYYIKEYSQCLSHASFTLIVNNQILS